MAATKGVKRERYKEARGNQKRGDKRQEQTNEPKAQMLRRDAIRKTFNPTFATQRNVGMATTQASSAHVRKRACVQRNANRRHRYGRGARGWWLASNVWAKRRVRQPVRTSRRRRTAFKTNAHQQRRRRRRYKTARETHASPVVVNRAGSGKRGKR